MPIVRMTTRTYQAPLPAIWELPKDQKWDGFCCLSIAEKIAG
jgi:hypothetical protein